MADTLLFTEGANQLANGGWPATVTFALSTGTIGSTLTAATTYAGTFSEITGTGYARLTQAEPTASGAALSFALMSWSTGSATNWPATTRTLIAIDASTSKLLYAWHLQAGGVARAMNAASVTENVTPSITYSA